MHYQHRYVFSNYARDPVNASPPQGIVKLDTLKGTEDSWIGDADQYLSEPLFAKKKGAGKDIFILLVFGARTVEIMIDLLLYCAATASQD